MEDLLYQIGKRLYERRKERKLTQEMLAELAGITYQTVSSAELGKKALRPQNIIRLCSALDMSTDQLLLGNTGKADSHLPAGISRLSPAEYRLLEDIVNSYIEAMQKTGK